MSLETLDTNSLYVLLFIRDHPPKPNDFHWAYYFHRDTKRGGTKYHVRGVGGGWIPAHEDTHAVMKEFLLVGLFKIADISPKHEEKIDPIMRTFDGQLNRPEITCRVWLLWVLDILQHTDDGDRIVKCDTLNDLEAEIKDWGNQHAMSAANNVQPRPAGASLICGL
ncbi:hypothetical protein N7493_011968 [Penicillium malachiteum]|uniref:Uncharacterized protein n=1 Tax=Penicillium malachiteum TaxID=1324776 RepID=A0AAD6HA01_9EURO|nr:hypothetical protein N7493_011968 [Penicillium malachiteum]